MSRPQSYVGVSGITTRSEAEAALAAFPDSIDAMRQLKDTLRHLLNAVVLMLLLGCSQVDRDDWSALVDRIAALPPAVLRELKHMVAAQRAISFLDGKPPNEKIGQVRCYDADVGTDASPTAFEYTVTDMLKCIRDGVGELARYRTWYECHNRFMLAHDNGYSCLSWEDAPGYNDVPKVLYPENVEPEDIAEAFISSAAPMPGFGAPMRGLLPILCPLDVQWSCPESPLYPPGQTPQPGDHQ